MLTIPAHQAQIYSANFSPHSPELLATCASDGAFKVFDLRSAPNPTATVQVGNTEVLGLDWNKYTQMTVATVSSDKLARVWDLRTGKCISVAKGHTLAVRRVQ
jgi:peroxin-7